MIESIESIVIAAPLPEVWQFITNPYNLNQFESGMTNVQVLEQTAQEFICKTARQTVIGIYRAESIYRILAEQVRIESVVLSASGPLAFLTATMTSYFQLDDLGPTTQVIHCSRTAYPSWLEITLGSWIHAKTAAMLRREVGTLKKCIEGSRSV